MPKVARDPSAPKRNMSAYLLYQNAMRKPFKKQHPGMTFGQLSKYTSAMYANLTPPEKESWVARAEADKERYNHELANYVPPPGYDPKGDALAPMANAPGGGAAGGHPNMSGRKKADKDSGAPKRNVSAYLHYQNSMRDQFKSENPGMSFGQLSKYTSHMYKNLSPEEKAFWEVKAKHDKERYIREMHSYVPPPHYDAHGNLIDDSSKGRRRKAPRDPSAPKRARGSFVFFTQEERPRILQEFPGIKFVEMGTILGQRWRALTAEQKKKFEALAAQDKVRFHMEMQQYPGSKEYQAVNNQQQQQQQQQPMMEQHQPQHQLLLQEPTAHAPAQDPNTSLLAPPPPPQDHFGLPPPPEQQQQQQVTYEAAAPTSYDPVSSQAHQYDATTSHQYQQPFDQMGNGAF